MDSSSNGNRKRKLLYAVGTQSSPYNKKCPFGELMDTTIGEMSSKAYIEYIKDLYPNVPIDSKKNKRLECPQCFFRTSEKDDFDNHKKQNHLFDNKEFGKKNEKLV